MIIFRSCNRYISFITLLSIVLFGFAGEAYAYIGPGAGFAFLSSFFVLFITFALVLFYLFTWPFRFVIKAMFRGRGKTKSSVDRVVIVGLDGMDAKLTDKYISEGKLPNFEKLKSSGSFAPLSTSYPSMSPVAWSSFMTGVDPSYHNIFDFLTRDSSTYMPKLSSAEIGKSKRVLPIGKYRIPLGKPMMKLHRKSKPFWHILGENGVFSAILRVPITFPPEKFNGVLISGMCTPDLKGSQGTFSYYTTNKEDKRGKSRGILHHVTLKDNIIHTYLYGPENGLVDGGGELTAKMTIKIDRERNKANIKICNQEFDLEPGNYSPWIKVTFRPGLGMKVSGICLFHINSISPDFELYISPINIDPEKPALPVSHPYIYSIYFAKLIGAHATLGLAEDTWALNEGVIDEDAFLKQAYLMYEEREKMFFSAMERTTAGLCTCVFDTTDRIQHMFFRFLDETHPANDGVNFKKYENVIEELYKKMDKLIGKVMEKMDKKTALFVMSDHGFTQFKRGVNLNRWLLENGYLALEEGKSSGGDWFEHVDWSKTKAYSLGLAGIFINRKGREAQGIVNDGEELDSLKKELVEKLTGLVDEETKNIAIVEVVETEKRFVGPYTRDNVDLLVGFNKGYRTSWGCATGRVAEKIFEDNSKAWSGDHCVKPELVPGVLFSNRKINTANPDIKDIAPSVLKLFGITPPKYMQGKPLL